MTATASRRSTVRDLLTVMSGTAGAQAIGLLILPVLARVFVPEAFGVFQLYLSLLIFCSVGIALRIELTLVSRHDDEVHHTLASLFGLVLVVALFVTAALSLYSAFGASLGFPAALLGLGLIGNGCIQIASYKLIRDQSFSRLAKLKVGQVLIYALVALAMAALNPTLWGIIVADVIGRLTAGAYGLFAVQPTKAERTAPLVRLRGLPSFVRQNWELAIISLPGALANSGGAMLTPFMIFHVFGAAAAGQYGLVDRAMGVPVAMIVVAGSQVFLGRVTEQIRAGNRAAVLNIFVKIVVAGAVICGVGVLVARALIPFAFDIAFGPGWGPAIEIARIMIFGYAVALVMGIVNQTLIALRAFRLQSAWDFGWPVCIGLAWILVVTQGLDLYTAISLHAAAVSLLGLIFILLCIAKLRGASTPEAAEA
ncbi:MAG: oligosaccharide flippase family protein [Sphingopyxis sp.]|uniref:lipopolysaccharide biosynthesis protein n=1 Tax=Sphingopyxis sp. TaxID=1908224 RepID=UPI001A324F83|nr:oligosaccharide flippase family protein [Sphingopyxis sp.]MBJ7498554.1 oligosaccharide flippase family protein [Sphingopyxis sp.]